MPLCDNQEVQTYKFPLGIPADKFCKGLEVLYESPTAILIVCRVWRIDKNSGTGQYISQLQGGNNNSEKSMAQIMIIKWTQHTSPRMRGVDRKKFRDNLQELKQPSKVLSRCHRSLSIIPAIKGSLRAE